MDDRMTMEYHLGTSDASLPLSTQGVTDQFVDDVTGHWWVRGLFIALYCVIFILGICGNTLVIYVVIRNKEMKTITNTFITNLAVSDILLCLLAIPFTPVSAFSQHWVLGTVLCHVLPMSLAVGVYVSTLTSLMIAIDRYMVIVHPYQPRIQYRTCLLIIVLIWLVSILVTIPLGIYQKVVYNKDGTSKCGEHWPKEAARQFFNFTSLVLQYLVPCSSITFCYVKVWDALSVRSRSRRGFRMREDNDDENRRKIRTNRMLVAMISIFVICWLPLNVWILVGEYCTSSVQNKYFQLLFFMAHELAMSSTIYNPFLYSWMNDNFRKEFRKVFPLSILLSDKKAGQSLSYTTLTQRTNPTANTIVSQKCANGKDTTPVIELTE